MFRKRFNVAASRARDQMWVIHSLVAATDLQPNDLRRQLIEYAEDPNQLMPPADDEDRPESELERRVRLSLEARRIRIIRRWRVGYYSIDLVAESDGKKLAIACEGDRVVSPERLADELERQAVLERLGWVFVRVRGSEFFLDPDKALAPVFRKLDELQIVPSEPENTETPTDHGLADRVVERAALLRRSWGFPHVKAAIATDRRTSGTALAERRRLEAGSGDEDARAIRPIEAISDAEIRGAILDCVPSAGDVEHNHLLLSAAHQLGYRNVNADLMTRLNTALDLERLAGRLETVTGIQIHRRIGGPE